MGSTSLLPVGPHSDKLSNRSLRRLPKDFEVAFVNSVEVVLAVTMGDIWSRYRGTPDNHSGHDIWDSLAHLLVVFLEQITPKQSQCEHIFRYGYIGRATFA